MSDFNRTYIVKETKNHFPPNCLTVTTSPPFAVFRWNSDGTRLSVVKYYKTLGGAKKAAANLFAKNGNS